MIKTELKKFYEIIKICKTGMIMFKDNISILLDGNQGSVTIIEYNPFTAYTTDTLIFDTLQLQEFRKAKFKELNIKQHQYGISIMDIDSTIIVNNTDFNNTNLSYKHEYILKNNLILICNTHDTLHHENNLFDIPEFVEMMKLKSSNSSTFIKLGNKYYMNLYPRILPILKSDKSVSVDIKYENPSVFISIMTIEKKLFNVKLYMRFLYNV